jgi:putative flippase GtrA
MRFAASGGINTLVHNAVVIALVESFRWAASHANVLAFFLATLFSFWLNSRWTFGRQLELRRLPRFIAVGLLGLAVTVLIAVAAEVAGLHYLGGQAAIVLTVPPLTFLLHRLWTFDADSDRRAPPG